MDGGQVSQFKKSFHRYTVLYNLFTIYSVREFQYLIYNFSDLCSYIIFFSSNSGPIYEVGGGAIWGVNSYLFAVSTFWCKRIYPIYGVGIRPEEGF